MDRFNSGPRDRRLIDRLPIEMWQTALSYLCVQDILPHVPRCCRFLRECVWGPWSAGLLWRELDLSASNVLCVAASDFAPIAHVRTLIAGGANVNPASGMTPLLMACEFTMRDIDITPTTRIDMIRVLLDARADVNARFDGYTPLIDLCHYEHIDAVQLLISRGADVNLCGDDGYGYTALMVASNRRNLQMIEVLLDARADINARNDDGRTALDEAVMYGRNDIAQFLFSKLQNQTAPQ